MSEANGDDDTDGTGGDESSEVGVAAAKPKLAEPRKFAVLIHNDDYSTFDFVVEVLQKFFAKPRSEAEKITVAVHHQGKGLAGVYSFEIAETKAAQVGEYAEAHGFPLKASTEAI